MLTLIFRSPNALHERVCGPSRTIAITPEAIYCDGRLSAQFRYALWHVDGAQFTAAEVVGPATVAFARHSAPVTRKRGPFASLRIISGYLFDGSKLLACAIAGRWYTHEEDEEFDQIVLEYHEEPAPAERAPGILVVEDNDIERIGLTAFLRGKGYRVFEAHNGQEALDRLDKEVPDLILLDMKMPQLDGWHFLAERRLDPRLVSVPVVIVTGLANVGESLEDEDADAVVSKPIQPENLLETVRQLVS
jgi:CheY-like chemotaxis protein